jgi:hypothetical protein
MFNENKMSKVTEILIFLIIPIALYDHMKNTPPNIYGFPFMILGFLIFLIPKISQIGKGKLVSFGCEGLTQRMSLIYFSGVLLMFVGFLITFPIFHI